MVYLLCKTQQMKKGIQAKLNAYASAAGTIALAGAADAQIVYTDINPDTMVHDSLIYVLDFDNNGQPELQFATNASSSTYYATVEVLGNASNAIIGSLFSATYPFPAAMNNGDSISFTNTGWQNQALNSGVQYLGVVTSSGGTYANFLGANDKYLGVRFSIGPNTHYGWVRLSLSASAANITIKDYAYQTLPGVGITAGQLVGIPTAPQNNNINVFASANTVVINNTESEKGGVVRIVNTLGQSVYESAVTEENIRISLEGQAAGIYFVEVLRDGSHFTKKIYIY